MPALFSFTETHLKGFYYESLAERYLKKQGLRMVEKNYRCSAGEIDLVMRDKDKLVFVEVRFRQDEDFGSALETVDRRKQLKVRRAAEHFLLRHKDYAKLQCRFDVIGITRKNAEINYNWLCDAFE